MITPTANIAAPERPGIRFKSHIISYRTAYLGYLLLYPVPWVLHGAPDTGQLAFSLAAIGIFLTLYFAPYRQNRRFGPPEIVLSALIGFSSMWTGGDYIVFNVYASAMTAAIETQQRRLVFMTLLQVSLISFCTMMHCAPIEPALGVLFSIITFVGTRLQCELGRRNDQLQKAQHEIHVLAATAERERIARDMHDLLGHSLTVISVKAELAQRMFATDSARSEAEIADIRRIARTSLADVRHAVSGMNGTSLRHTLSAMTDALHAAGIDALVTGADQLPDGPHTSVLAMALREAVTNVIRHSRARSCHITFTHDRTGRVVAVTVRDEGKQPVGDTPPASTPIATVIEGSGLSGMRARLKAAGGSLTLSKASTGMILKASLTS